MNGRTRIDYDTLVKTDRVHSRVYTDPAIFADEMEKIFHRGWVFVGHSGEVPNTGDFRLKRIGSQPIIMVRDQSGKVQLLLNRCRHRGAAVCQYDQGNLRSFKCAYHGWTYKLDGSLAGVPYPEAYGEDFQRDEFGLTKVPRVESYRGFIFASLSPAGITLKEHLGRSAQEIDLFAGFSDEDEIEVVSGLHKYNFNANWKLAVENSMDGYHPNVTHESFVAAVMERIKSHPSPEHGKAGFNPDSFSTGGGGISKDLGGGHVMLDYGFRIYDPLNGDPLPTVRAINQRGEAHMAEIAARVGAERGADGLREGATHTLIFPNLILIGLHLRVVQPVSLDYTEVCLYPTTLKWLAPEVNEVRLRSHEAFFGSGSFGGPDDSEIFERIQTAAAADLEPWNIISRGMNHERRDEEGLLVGAMTDEITQRAIWRQWKKVMTQETGASARKRASHAAGERG
ncbi:MAG: Rieske 2Fe-2S domain-containing protein [Candidatus Binataceae bacterium]|nr:Rieske 2Fe-2S domain-containing protein [Candidatus Binataceae bacterium]